MDGSGIDVDVGATGCIPELQVLPEFVERLAFVPETILVANTRLPIAADAFDFERGDSRGGGGVELVQLDELARLVEEPARVEGCDRVELADDALVADADIGDGFARTLIDCRSNRRAPEHL